MLNEQVGIVNFEPYLDTVLAMYARARMSFGALPNVPPLHAHLHRNWKEASGKDLLPIVSEYLIDPLRLANRPTDRPICPRLYSALNFDANVETRH